MKLAVITKLDDREQLLYLKSNGNWDSDPLSAKIMAFDEAIKIVQTSKTFVGIFAWDPKNDPCPFLGMDSDYPLVNLSEASKMLNINLPTLCSRVKNRNLPHCYRGRKTYITRETFEKFVVPKTIRGKRHG